MERMFAGSLVKNTNEGVSMKIASVVFLVLAGTVTVFTQSKEQTILFGKQKVCTYALPFETVLKKYDSAVRNIFTKGKVVSTKLTAVCSDRTLVIREKDTTVYLTDSFLELYYTNKDAEKVFEHMVKVSKKPVSPGSSEFWELTKGGKILCLQKGDDKLVMITLNGCANGPLLEKIVKSLRNTHKYDKVMAVKCGADPRYIEIF